MNRIPLRVRLTLLTTLAFGLTLSGAAVAGLAGLDSALRAGIQSNAEALLASYLDELGSGIVAPGLTSPQESTQFVYLNESGNELTSDEYEELLLGALPAELQEDLADDLTESDPLDVLLDSDFPITVAQVPDIIEQNDDVLIVGTDVRVGETPVTIGVSSPLRPVTTSTEAIAKAFLLFVPLLTAAIAAATWVIVGRALRPVDAITAQVDQISNDNLDQRVPQSETDDEIGRLAITMNHMLARLEQARDRQRQFISDASHELNSPIAVTQTTLEVAQRQPDATDWQATAETLQAENKIMASLVADLLTLARLEEKDQQAADQDIDLEEVCSEEARRLASDLVHVRVEAPGRITGNPDHIRRAIRNLLDNAARHADQRVDVTISQHQDTTIVEIRDDGPGIPPENREQIFERFTQLDPSRTHTQGRGAGLGLAITKQIILNHHGTIRADNHSNGGAVITIHFPAEGIRL